MRPLRSRLIICEGGIKLYTLKCGDIVFFSLIWVDMSVRSETLLTHTLGHGWIEPLIEYYGRKMQSRHGHLLNLLHCVFHDLSKMLLLHFCIYNEYSCLDVLDLLLSSVAGGVFDTSMSACWDIRFWGLTPLLNQCWSWNVDSTCISFRPDLHL